MRAPLLALAALVLLAPAAGAAPVDFEPFFAHWPASLEEARENPVEMRPAYPHGAEDLDDGPLLPGSSTAGTVPTFTFHARQGDAPGFADDRRLVDGAPARVQLFVSADPAPEPGTDAPLAAPEAGAAPNLTVEATVTVDGETVARDAVTQTVVTGGPEGEPATRYVIEAPVDGTAADAGAPIELTLSIYQVDGPERLTQPRVKVHTGEEHPTVLSLPTEASQPDEGPALSIDAFGEDPRATRSVATVALVGALTVAALAAVRLGYLWTRD